MDLPAIVLIEENVRVLEAAKAELCERYGRHYTVHAEPGTEAAVELLERLAADGDDIALVLIGQSAFSATSGSLFDLARQRHPLAKRVLLVGSHAWVDSDRAELIRAAMALGRIDHFVLQPATAPDEVFHEAMSGFLHDWARECLLVPQTVHIVGEGWSGRAYELRSVLESCALPHEFSLADSEKGRQLIERAGPDVRLPLMVLPDGRMLKDPTNAQIAEAAGAPQVLDGRTFDLLIVGAGPAGLSAAVYGASEGLDVVVLDSAGIGGQARSSSLIRNYLGFAHGVSGSRLAQEAYQQASLFGASFLFLHRAESLTCRGEEFVLLLEDGRRVSARSVLLSTGASYQRLGIPALEELTGGGVFYGGPVAEAPMLAGKDVFVVGGGNSAGQAALHLARFARHVTLLVRGDSLGSSMSHYLVQAIAASPKVEVRTGTTVVGGGGDGHLERLVLRDSGDGGETEVAADALFVMIGARPLTDWLPAGMARDRHGFLLTGEETGGAWPLERAPFPQETSIPRVFAAGDVRHGSIKRVAAAVGEGATAVPFIHQVLADDREPVELPLAQTG